MTSLYVAVVGHSDRQAQARQLASLAGGVLFLDDHGLLGEWRNHQRALTSAQWSSATHAVILQDDAVPVDDFLEHALRAAEERPHSLVSFYVGTGRPFPERVTAAVEEARATGASWLRGETLYWGVAVMVPVGQIESLLASCSRTPHLPYDQRLGRWAKQAHEDVWYTWPSLVDHRDQPSVISGRGEEAEPRVAHEVGVPSWSDASVVI